MRCSPVEIDDAGAAGLCLGWSRAPVVAVVVVGVSVEVADALACGAVVDVWAGQVE